MSDNLSIESTSKAIRREETNDEDRISQLPNSMLHLILSHLEIKHVVQTSVLARRWKTLWASMPYVFFDSKEHNNADLQISFRKFERFGNNVLLLRDALDIHTFRLWWHHFLDPEEDHILTTWAQHVVRHKVKVLEFTYTRFGDDMDDGYGVFRIVLPCCIYTCKSLEELRLEYCHINVDLDLPVVIRLVRLRKLHLTNMDVSDDTLKKLLAGCPVLEVLKIHGCTMESPDISVQTLRRLYVVGCQIGIAIRISTPSLQSLCFMRNTSGKIEVSLEELPSLVEASIQIDGITNSRKAPFKFNVSTSKALRNLRNMRLIGGCVKDNFQTVANFLRRSPKLELLELRNHISSPQCIQSSVNCSQREILIRCRCGEDNEEVVELVKEFICST